MDSKGQGTGTPRTAGEAGWHVSRYNLSAEIPDSNKTAIANLYRGKCALYTPLEMFLLSVIEELDENHPIIDRFAKRGVIVNFDERAALETMGRATCWASQGIGLTICPTMGCNFDCPYCFEDHRRGKMSAAVQDDVVALARRMFEASRARALHISWFGGEPLLVPDIIESLSERLMALAEEYDAEYSATIITNGYLLTQEVADMLGRCKVSACQVTIDGLEATHNATRYLRGGGPTFERIVSNLRNVKMPFCVKVRHNVYEGNRDEAEALEALVAQLAEESGNEIAYYPAPVSGSEVADERGRQVGLLCSSDASDIDIIREAGRFHPGRGHYCGAHTIWSVGVDDLGNLQKCWESVDKPYISFGSAHDWDPASPFETASNPDNLTKYLNTANPVPDDECRECVWLPTCVGGCPQQRLFFTRRCVPFRNDPEGFVLALHKRMVAERDKGEDEH